MRETMDEVALAELADSIADTGLQQPIRVFEAAVGFEVIAGHRRLLACRLVNFSPVPCIIDRNMGISTIAKMVAENSAREDVNPIEEARLYLRALEELCHNNTDELCELVKRRRAYVEDRLNLLAGDPLVITALEQRKIGIAVARELNRVGDPGRRLVYLDAAIRGGTSARQVMEWRTQSDGLPPSQPAPNCDVTTDGQAQRIPPAPGFECFFCGDGDDVHLMELMYLHRQCKKFVLKALGLEAKPTGG
jgi:ParB family chromosome partitioning protein